ncbi:unnamed protein product [Vitrella brassicaformis CCMP3155]|uniref:Cyclin-dependent kinase 2 homolog n=1 Tax=Vitrella brassicaformis (strain CCMP3155) TaxID=1169540 RepID=A0A0G4E899_VITBC|nr:unnamed protein product [Vitrella brassicaformis CCMP3155]|eukprot:CEL91886.1 unnamed protein product [Vitrella brassicaformis CCMP3155]
MICLLSVRGRGAQLAARQRQGEGYGRGAGGEQPHPHDEEPPYEKVLWGALERATPSLDEYEKEAVLGEGTDGTIYRARHKPTGRQVAIKTLSYDDCTVVIQLLDLVIEHAPGGNGRATAHLIFELIEHDLFSACRKRGHAMLDTREVNSIMQQLLAGLVYLHGHLVLHRDIKR